MPRHLSWELVVAWAAVGGVSGIAISEIWTRLVLLLVPAALVSAWLLWQVDATRDLGAGLVGLSVGPLLLAKEALHPPCAVTGGFSDCGSGPVGPWLVVAALLVLIGIAVMVVPRRAARDEVRTASP